MIKPAAAACLGNTGTTRYMAPEIILREDYGTKVDVFAASIVCWEVMTLMKPYGNDASGQYVKQCVAIYDDRPTIPARGNSKVTPWPKALRKLVQQGWNKDPAARLTAREMRQGLEAIVDKKQQLLPITLSLSSTSTCPQPQQQQQQQQHQDLSDAISKERSC
jgi:serine/threonine protein kinase